MKTEVLAQKIRENNGNDKRREKIAFVLFLLAQVLCSGKQNVLLWWGDKSISGELVSLILAFFYGREYWNSYLRIDRAGLDLFIEERFSLSDIARMHAFSSKEYFGYLRKKQLIYQGILLLAMAAAGLVSGSYGYCLFGFVAALVPFLVGLLKQADFEYVTYNRTKVCYGLLSGTLWIVELMVELFLMLALLFLGLALLSDYVAAGKFNEDIMLYRSYGAGWMYTVWMLLSGIYIIACYMGEKVVNRKMAVKCILILVLWGGLTMVVERYNYVEIRSDGLTVSTWKGKQDYGFSDVERYAIYEEDDGIQMRLYFRDGSNAELFSGTSTTSDLYDNTYYSEYNFVAALLPTLSEYGASGTIKDVDLLREDVADMDEELCTGLEEIIAIMEQ